MKLLGAGLIWTSLILVAGVYSVNLKKHVALLNKTINMLSEMKVQLEYLNMPVFDMINKINKSTGLDFLSECIELISEGNDFPTAWETSVNHAIYYKSAEKNELLQLGSNLGTSNRDNQIEIICMHKTAFEEFLIKAKTKEQKYGKLSITLGTLMGCMFFIMVI